MVDLIGSCHPTMSVVMRFHTEGMMVAIFETEVSFARKVS